MAWGGKKNGKKVFWPVLPVFFAKPAEGIICFSTHARVGQTVIFNGFLQDLPVEAKLFEIFLDKAGEEEVCFFFFY